MMTLKKTISYAAALGLVLIAGGTSIARADTDPPKAWQEVRALVVRFNDAQNAHNLDVVGALLVNSPDFVWSMGGVPLRGHDAAVNRLATIYQDTWRVSPDYGALDIRLTGPGEAQITMPSEFKTGVAGQDPVTTQAVVRERAVRTPDGWRLASVAIDPAPVAGL